ncbi:hypothetical protein [Parageobacillus thermoglucosidasius]|uniref:Nucleotidyltransferase n=3 Tax=Parageobacillus thermoglucosidasius TaxID=1426 RepID=A0AB38QW69_PARTM|nr:hypothetical protein [Parageobacillus thermoglucosidasius]GAJ43647.1 hypothetical protein GT2_11_00230 [Parageobacillus thermoglucosidasius NBRC 107763]AEH46727.1 hypothetical protein Geoth_0728 [Parageobacillus thermoglucosidasius C56-YS93]ALF11887.1 hypothetical protein AOT13_18645 [Parageobacillus thermoglucosidasius]ANZ31971.1 hypothetical protein BCV53_18705 [Parageobacillus thermoglucosidasius]APM82705.1 hypothetical protein BCV54_18720 [Parageobacillus thermoglucosidasius]
MMKAIASHEGGLTWQQAVKKVIRNVMVEYYRAVPSLRSPFYMLKLIETYRRLLHPHLFESPIHYYTVLAKITDHLLQFFTSGAEAQRSPLLLFAQATYRHGKGRGKTNVDIDFVYEEDGTYTMRKLLLEDAPSFVYHYAQIAPAACKQTFGFYPKKIEFCSLLTGERMVETTDTFQLILVT